MDSIIFDLDGTLWDTTSIVAKAWEDCIYEETGETYHITSNYLKSQFGKLLSQIADDLFATKELKERTRLMDLCCNREHQAILDANPSPYEGIEKVLNVLSQTYSLFIVSNCQAGYIEVFLETTKLSNYFKDHLCPGDTNKDKAYNIGKIISDHQLKSPVYVGDTMGDYHATKANNLPFIFASYGFGKVEKPDIVLTSPEDLLMIL